MAEALHAIFSSGSTPSGFDFDEALDQMAALLTNVAGHRRPPPSLRVIEVSAGDAVTAAVMNAGGETLNLDLIGHLAGATQMRFRHIASGRETVEVSFSAIRFPDLVRHVCVSRDQREYGTTGWQFSESGSPFAFEETDAYRHPRVCVHLTLEAIAAYVGSAGIGLAAWQSRRFHRAVDVGPHLSGLSLDAYADHARRMGEALDQFRRRMGFE